MHALHTRKDLQVFRAEDAEPVVSPRGLTLSELWESATDRDQVLAMEGDIERGDYPSAVRRADGLLREYVGVAGKEGAPLAEALLMVGVCGAYYARLRQIFARQEPSKADALFCLFFLTDVELRMKATALSG